MADLAELLSVEHIAIRHIRRSLENGDSVETFGEFHRYLKECHVEIEEKILFPILKAYVWTDSQEFVSKADRILADHKLIDTLHANLIKWYTSGDLETYHERLPLYFKLLLEHNEREEEIVFPRWDRLPADEIIGTVREAENIIESFGMKKYMEMVGLREPGYRYLFRK